MPYSWDIFDGPAAEAITVLDPKRALDVGAGAGKYGKMLKELVPDCRRIAYEPERSYMEAFGLRDIYHELRPYPIQNIMQTRVGIQEVFDLVIFGDVLEHLLKSDGLDIIHWMLYRCRFMLVMVPWQYIQNDAGGIIWEAHVSSWHPSEFIPFTDVSVLDAGIGWLGLMRGFMCEKELYEAKMNAIPRFIPPAGEQK